LGEADGVVDDDGAGAEVVGQFVVGQAEDRAVDGGLAVGGHSRCAKRVTDHDLLDPTQSASLHLLTEDRLGHICLLAAISGYNRYMDRYLYIVLTLCLMLTASSCSRSPRPTIGPSPSAASAAQLTKIQGHWKLAPVPAGPEPLPFTQLSVTVQGTVVSGVANPGSVAFQGNTEYQQPRPGGGRLRLTAALPSTAGEITMVVDWCDDAREGNGGWFAGAGLKDTLTFAITQP